MSPCSPLGPGTVPMSFPWEKQSHGAPQEAESAPTRCGQAAPRGSSPARCIVFKVWEKMQIMGQFIFLPAPKAGLLQDKPRGRTWGKPPRAFVQLQNTGSPMPKPSPSQHRDFPKPPPVPVDVGSRWESQRVGYKTNAEPRHQCECTAVNAKQTQKQPNVLGFWGSG